MENVRKLEGVVAGWFKALPHLPVNTSKWLAQNAWWLVLIWVVVSGLGIAVVLLGTFILGTAATLFGPIGAALGSFAILWVSISMLFSIATMVIGAIAVSPLKMMQKQGWTLLLIIALLNIVVDVLAFVFNFNLFSLIWNLLFVAVGAYFLFEVREYFDGAKATRKKVTAKRKTA